MLRYSTFGEFYLEPNSSSKD